jgi:hypothetical protein
VLGATGLAQFVADSRSDEWAKQISNKGGNLGFKSFADARNYLAEQKDPSGLNADVRLAKEQAQAIATSAQAAVGMVKTELTAEAAIVAPEAKAVMEETATEKAVGPYANLEDHPSVGPGKDFTKAQKRNIIEENRKLNGGNITSDESSKILGPGQQSKKGIAPSANEAHVDHIIPKAKGGSNSYGNAQVLSREENLKKSDN